MPKSINVRVYPQEEKVIQQMKTVGLPVNEIIRGLIRDYGEKHFPEPPAYAKAMLMRAEVAKSKNKTKQELDEMSNEEYATKVLYGKVIGDQVYFLNAQQIYSVALDSIKGVQVEDEWMRAHREMLSNQNQFISKEWREKMMRDWEKIGN